MLTKGMNYVGDQKDRDKDSVHRLISHPFSTAERGSDEGMDVEKGREGEEKEDNATGRMVVVVVEDEE